MNVTRNTQRNIGNNKYKAKFNIDSISIYKKQLFPKVSSSKTATIERKISKLIENDNKKAIIARKLKL